MLILGVPAERIRALGETWDDGGLWDDILWLALLARAATDDRERRMRWHHLVMAVGNFKRQRGRRLRPSRISPADKFTYAARADHFNGPDDLTISRDDADSWQHLEDSLAGAATATTTTLLAALWPDSHHILDWRVLAAAAGLGLVAGDENGLDLVTPGGRDPRPPALELYSRVRTVLITQSARAGVPLPSGPQSERSTSYQKPSTAGERPGPHTETNSARPHKTTGRLAPTAHQTTSATLLRQPPDQRPRRARQGWNSGTPALGDLTRGDRGPDSARIPAVSATDWRARVPPLSGRMRVFCVRSYAPLPRCEPHGWS